MRIGDRGSRWDHSKVLDDLRVQSGNINQFGRTLILEVQEVAGQGIVNGSAEIGKSFPTEHPSI